MKLKGINEMFYEFGLSTKEEYNESIDEALITFGGKAYPKFGQIVIISGGAGCFRGNTEVNTDKGLKPIKDILVGDKVLSFNEETKMKEYKTVDNLFIYDNDKTLLELTFDNGEVIVCTEDHEFLIGDEWVQAKDILVEDN